MIVRYSGQKPRIKFVKGRGQLGELPRVPWWIWLAGAAGVGGVLYLLFSDSEPRSMPITFPGTKTGFVAQLRAAIETVMPGLSEVTKQMIVAHAAYESGWGKATAFKDANNPFNLTTVSGPSVPGPDTEYDAAGNVKKITQQWAMFDSVENGVVGYLNFIRASRYSDAYNRLINGDTGFLGSLYRGGYFTLPLPTYQDNYASVLAQVQKEWSNA